MYHIKKMFCRLIGNNIHPLHVSDIDLHLPTTANLYYTVKPKFFDFWLISSCCAT